MTATLVFAAGGIGTIPFRSIIKQRVHDEQPANVTLIYGAEHQIFHLKTNSMNGWVTDPSLKVYYVSGKPLTADALVEVVPELNSSLAHLSGSELMVEALGDDLKKYGLPESQLKQDFFHNYNENNY